MARSDPLFYSLCQPRHITKIIHPNTHTGRYTNSPSLDTHTHTYIHPHARRKIKKVGSPGGARAREIFTLCVFDYVRQRAARSEETRRRRERTSAPRLIKQLRSPTYRPRARARSPRRPSLELYRSSPSRSRRRRRRRRRG